MPFQGDAKIYVGDQLIWQPGGGDVYPVDDAYPGQANVDVGARLTWDGSEWEYKAAPGDAFAFLLGLNPSAAWPLVSHSDLADHAGIYSLTSSGTAPSTVSGPSDAIPAAVGSAALDLRNGSLPVNGSTSYAYGGWFYATAWGEGPMGNWNSNGSAIIGTGPSVYHGGSAMSVTLPATDSWHHLFVTWDGSTQRFFVDGTQQTSRSIGTNPGGGTVFNIGTYNNRTGNRMNGAAAHCAWWRNVTVPTPTQIADLYAIGANV